MTDESPPLKLTLRLILEAVQGTLAFVLAGIAAVDLAEPWNVIIPLIVGAMIVLIGRLLGQNATDAVNRLSAILDQALARNNVLVSAATPTVIRKADEAAASIAGTSAITSPPVVPKG